MSAGSNQNVGPYIPPGSPPEIDSRDPPEGKAEKEEPVTVSPESQDLRVEG